MKIEKIYCTYCHEEIDQKDLWNHMAIKHKKGEKPGFITIVKYSNDKKER